jgi:hypothetical protein
MASEPKSRRRRRKKILRRNDGALYDATERRRISHAELRDYVRDGGLFEARRHENGADCTYEVLQNVMGVGMLQNLVPGLSGGGIPRLGGLSALANGGGGGGLAEIARMLGDHVGGSGDRGWEDWDERPRRTPRRTDDGGWGKEERSEKSKRTHRHDDPNRANDPDGAPDPDWDTDPDFD